MELPETPADFGGGEAHRPLPLGTIEADKRRMPPTIRGNMASSGLEIRINGRCIERGLYSKVLGKALHPSCNRFLAQIDLRGEDSIAFPATETTKNAFVEGDARTQALFRWIRANVRQPETSRESLESRLVGKLAEKKAAESDTLRIGREEGTYRTIGLQGKIDLLVSKTGGMTIYEAKAKNTKAEDLYQLRLYADGCAMDGMPAKESVLIGRVIRRRCAVWQSSSTASATPRESRTTSSSRLGRKRASAHDALSGDRREGDGGEHPPPPDREGLHGFGHAAVPEPRVPSPCTTGRGGRCRTSITFTR